ncbi:MAG: hypothetical protein WC561_05215 [Candidatus Omnitrophota bacterium]
MDNREITLKQSLIELYNNCSLYIDKKLEEGNKLWYGVIRLMITLASSFLLISLALVDKLFKTVDGVNIPSFLIYGWIGLLATIILSTIQEIEGSLFYSRLAEDMRCKRIEYGKRICKGETDIPTDLDKKTIIYSNILWGVLAINSFVISVIFIALSFLLKVLPDAPHKVILLISFIILGGIDMYFLIQYNKLRKR